MKHNIFALFHITLEVQLRISINALVSPMWSLCNIYLLCQTCIELCLSLCNTAFGAFVGKLVHIVLKRVIVVHSQDSGVLLASHQSAPTKLSTIYLSLPFIRPPHAQLSPQTNLSISSDFDFPSSPGFWSSNEPKGPVEIHSTIPASLLLIANNTPQF